ncbi:MAG: hypothetical protein GY719_01470 [bacterium]|nr:hypothetical protein [bacterium]
MSSQTTKEVLQVLEQTEFVIASTLVQKPVISAELKSILEAPEGEGEGAAVPDWDLLQDTHVSLLQRSMSKVRQADRDHRVNKIQLSQLRKERRGQIKTLKGRHRDLRRSFTGTYGEESLPFVGLDAPPAVRHVAVREQALEVLDRMRDPELASQVGDPRSGQVALDLGLLADALQDEILQLEEMTLAIQEMRKRLDESLLAKREALEAHRRVYVNVTRIQEGYYRLAGRDELADRIRHPDPPRRSASGEQPGPVSDETQTDEASPTEGESEPVASAAPAETSEA